MHHELTGKISKIVGQSRCTWDERDSIIRQWLKEKAEELDKECVRAYYAEEDSHE